MSGGLAFAGLIIAPLPVSVALALGATLALSALLARLGAYRWLWHRPMIEVSLLCVLVAIFDTALGWVRTS